jgi:hypothetical protein
MSSSLPSSQRDLRGLYLAALVIIGVFMIILYYSP